MLTKSFTVRSLLNLLRLWVTIASVEAQIKAWNQEKLKLAGRGDWLDVKVGTKGPCRHCMMHILALIFLAQTAPSWFWRQVVREVWLSRDHRRWITVNLGHSSDSIPFAHDWFRRGMWHNHGQWDVKEISTGHLCKGFLCSLKENVEGNFLFCLWTFAVCLYYLDPG